MATGASFLEPGLDFRNQKFEFSDILRGFKGQVELGHMFSHISKSFVSFPTTFRHCFSHFLKTHYLSPFSAAKAALEMHMSVITSFEANKLTK